MLRSYRASDAVQCFIDDESVDLWFEAIKDINRELLEPYRRQAGKRVKIGILDTGIDLGQRAFDREDVRRRIKKVVDFCGEGSGRDRCGHGTYCAALINKIAPAADVYVGRVAIDTDSRLDENVVAEAIEVALSPKRSGHASSNWDVDILSLSLSFPYYSEVIDRAIRRSNTMGKIILAAASNSGLGTLSNMAYPAWNEGVIAINSANARGRPSDFNPPVVEGKTLTILGENVPSAWATVATAEAGGAAADIAATKRLSGTAVATPIAAGLVALLIELAMIEIPIDPQTQAILKDVLPHVKRQAGVNILLKRVAVKTGDYYNIVPVNLLNPSLTVYENAAFIKGILARWFNFRKGD